MPDARSFPARAGVAVLAALTLLVSAPRADAPVLKVTEFGAGPAIVFVPDFGMGRTVWMPTARRLIATHRVVLVDLPGHGDSPMIDPFSYSAAAEALTAVLARFPGDSTVVVGQGSGGLIAAYAARAHPERVRGLVLIDVTMKLPMRIEDQQRKMFLKWMDENYDAFVRRSAGSRGRDSIQSAEILSQALLIPPANAKPYFREMLALDETALRNFPRPVLYIGTSRQWPAGTPWGAYAAERGLDVFGAADTLRIPDAAALVMKDRPDTLAAAIAAFAGRVIAKR